MSWLGGLFHSLKRGPDRINDYFRNAVRVYALSGEQGSKAAALTAGKVAADQQRGSMVAYLRGMSWDSRREPQADDIRAKLDSLADEIAAKDWSIADIREAKLALGKISPEYLTALNKFDPDVFQRKWPALFERGPSEAIESLRATLAESGELTPDEEAVLRSPAKLQDLLQIPHDAMQIVGDYSKVLAEDTHFLRPISSLPHSKETIRSAITTAMSHAKDAETRQSLQTLLETLGDFVPAEEVPADPEENVKAWLVRRAGHVRTEGSRALSPERSGEAHVLDPVNITTEVDRFFDDSSIAGGAPLQFALVLGPTATGKTRHRRQKYAKGYVVVDAADIFINLSRGKYIDFPSFLEEPLDIIGATVARRAVRERRHIVTEIIGHELPPTQQVIDAMLAIGYKVNVDYIQKDVVEAWEWNINRSDNNISAYYTEPFHRKWLLGAAAESGWRPGPSPHAST